MLKCEGIQMFRGTMRVTPKNPKFPMQEIYGDWLCKSFEDGDTVERYWYCNGHSYAEEICEIVEDET